jgi:hypothetical protein
VAGRRMNSPLACSTRGFLLNDLRRMQRETHQLLDYCASFVAAGAASENDETDDEAAILGEETRRIVHMMMRVLSWTPQIATLVVLPKWYGSPRRRRRELAEVRSCRLRRHTSVGCELVASDGSGRWRPTSGDISPRSGLITRCWTIRASGNRGQVSCNWTTATCKQVEIGQGCGDAAAAS